MYSMGYMSTDKTYSISSQKLEDTLNLGKNIGAKLKGGEVIELVGDVGSGKTVFVRGLAKGAGSDDAVASPSFTISRVYHCGDFDVSHYDFYRLDDAGIIRAELDEAAHDEKAVIAVEWSGIVDDVLPKERVRIEIKSTGDESRDIEISVPQNLKYLGEDL